VHRPIIGEPSVPGKQSARIARMTETRRLVGRVVAITGAGGGIGRAIARAFAAEGASLALADLGDAVEAVADGLRGETERMLAVPGDVTRADDMARLADQAVGELGGLDVLVTCAGVDHPGLLAEQDEATWTRVIDVNLIGTYRAIRATLPAMMRRGEGRIVTIASVYGKVGGAGFITAYVASKHGVIGLTRALAAELGSQGYPGITVNAVCPGYVRAGMGVRSQSTRGGPMSGAEIFERYVKRQVPLRRMMEAEEVAHVAVFLALPASGGITGQALNVDGGWVTA
jgi:NAD(P)-dependent dehydrogenase (short-subunit alcohol dehydrogenase family)